VTGPARGSAGADAATSMRAAEPVLSSARSPAALAFDELGDHDVTSS